MSRRRSAERREVAADPRFGSKTVTRFVNFLMKDGKKSVAERILYKALDEIKEKFAKGSSALEIFEAAIENVKPKVEVRSKRLGGATYQVPTEVRPVRALKLAMTWIILSARKRGGLSMVQKLAAEIWDAFNKRGGAMKKCEDVHKMADANKAFAHYAR